MLALAPMVMPEILLSYYLIRQESRNREFEHKEQTQALQLGRVLPGDESWWSSARISLAIGLVVPLGVFCCAALATLAVGFHEEIWKAAGMVGAVGLLCAAFMAPISISWPQ